MSSYGYNLPYMKNNHLMPVTGLIILVISAAVLAGCTSPSSEIVTPKGRITMAETLKAKDCFFRVNDTAHSMNMGPVREVTVTGYISNTCKEPMDKVAVRATFTDAAGKALASAEGYAGYIGFHEIVPFSLSADIPSGTGSFSYELEPVIRQ